MFNACVQLLYTFSPVIALVVGIPIAFKLVNMLLDEKQMEDYENFLDGHDGTYLDKHEIDVHSDKEYRYDED
jgi:hypothetical protein